MPMSDQIPQNPSSPVWGDVNEPEGWLEYPLLDDVISGAPDCRVKLLRTIGVTTKELKACFFSADVSVFNWVFEQDESFVLLDGHLSLTMSDGVKYEVTPGQALSIAGGTHAVCSVLKPSRKFTVVTGCNC